MSISINLSKGANISLSKQDPSLKKVLIGLQWNPRTTVGVPFDLDASAFLCDASGKVTKVSNFVFYNNMQNKNRSVVHNGDNRDGQGDGDDETILVDLPNLPAEIVKIIIGVTIHDAVARGQNFGQVPSSAIRLCNQETIDAYKVGNPFISVEDLEKQRIGELARYDLQENYSSETSMVLGELYKTGAEWKFRAIGQGYSSGLQGLVNDYVAPNAEADLPA